MEHRCSSRVYARPDAWLNSEPGRGARRGPRGRYDATAREPGPVGQVTCWPCSELGQTLVVRPDGARTRQCHPDPQPTPTVQWLQLGPRSQREACDANKPARFWILLPTIAASHRNAPPEIRIARCAAMHATELALHCKALYSPSGLGEVHASRPAPGMVKSECRMGSRPCHATRRTVYTYNSST